MGAQPPKGARLPSVPPSAAVLMAVAHLWVCHPRLQLLPQLQEAHRLEPLSALGVIKCWLGATTGRTMSSAQSLLEHRISGCMSGASLAHTHCCALNPDSLSLSQMICSLRQTWQLTTARLGMLARLMLLLHVQAHCGSSRAHDQGKCLWQRRRGMSWVGLSKALQLQRRALLLMADARE